MVDDRVYRVGEVAVHPDAGAVAAAAGYPVGSSDTRMERTLRRAQGRYRVELAYSRDSVVVSGERIEIGGHSTLDSLSLSRFLRGCTGILLLASTLGARVSEDIERLGETGRMDEAHLLDAVASEMADEGLDVARRMAVRHLLNRGEMAARRRFSPGYGDVDLGFQRVLFDRLRLGDLGMSILPSCMLVPEKSVLAMVGIRRMMR